MEIPKESLEINLLCQIKTMMASVSLLTTRMVLAVKCGMTT